MQKKIDVNKPLTNAQKAMLEAVADRPVEPDDDCPELTTEQLAQFKKVAEHPRLVWYRQRTVLVTGA